MKTDNLRLTLKMVLSHRCVREYERWFSKMHSIIVPRVDARLRIDDGEKRSICFKIRLIEYIKTVYLSSGSNIGSSRMK